MQHVLDVDLDFFVEDPVHYPPGEGRRPEPAEHPVSDVGAALGFLREQCGLRRGRPGAAVDHHDEVFHHWRAAIAAGVLVPPFDVTHVDAHGDLGFGDAGYVYLMTSLLFEETGSRAALAVASGEVADSNYLAFAIACRWVAALKYVYPPGGGGDIFPYYRRGFRLDADDLQLAAMRPNQLQVLRDYLPVTDTDTDSIPWRVERLEPAVPLTMVQAEKATPGPPFDFVFIARSPEYSPPTADPLFERIRHEFIDEQAFADALSRAGAAPADRHEANMREGLS